MSPSKIPIFPVRLDSALKAAVVAGAKKIHMRPTDWIRQAIVEKAVRQGIEIPDVPEDYPSEEEEVPK